MSAVPGPQLFERVLGNDYARLAEPVRRFHRLAGRHVLHGWVETGAPSTFPARVLAWCLGTPRRATSGVLKFELDVRPDTESWTRVFPAPAQTMRSRMTQDGGFIVEKLGAATLWFALAEDCGRLDMRLARMRFAGLPCPGWLLPRVIATESAASDASGADDAGNLHFQIEAALPLAGVVASYRGHLVIPSQATGKAIDGEAA
ncbi:MAG: DUF4166 domain-containing protein [Comamonadaceae bacterium]|nr:MAG: DUF4166 domain-containing protein [Comamonadaceae bacterium]